MVLVLHDVDRHCVEEMNPVSVVSAAPKLTPLNVTAAPPEVGELNDVCETTGASKLNKLDRVPTICVIVTLAVNEFPVPAGEEHVRDVDDDHATVRHWLSPRATLGVMYVAPKLKPVMVTDVPEVVGALKDAKYVGTGESYVNMFTPVPCAVPISCCTASAIDLYWPEPAADEQSTAVSVDQLVVTQLALSMKAVGVASVMAKFAPSIVTIAMLSGPFGALMLVGTGASNVKIAVSVWLRPVTVKTSRFLSPVPYELTMHVTCVVLDQLTVPHMVPPSAAVTVASVPPKFEPDSVNDTPVDVGKFILEN